MMVTRTLSQALVIRLGAGEFAIPVEDVTEVLSMVELTALPESPPWLVGMVNLRGDVVPVVDLRVRLGIPAEPFGLSTPLIVVAAAGRRIALVSDGVTEVLAVRPEDVLPPDGMTGPDPAVDRVIRHGHRLILSLALDRVARELPAP